MSVESLRDLLEDAEDNGHHPDLIWADSTGDRVQIVCAIADCDAVLTFYDPHNGPLGYRGSGDDMRHVRCPLITDSDGREGS